MNKRVLLLGLKGHVLQSRAAMLRSAGYCVRVARSEEEAELVMTDVAFNAVVICDSFPDISCRNITEFIRDNRPECTIIVVSEAGLDGSSIEHDEAVLCPQQGFRFPGPLADAFSHGRKV